MVIVRDIELYSLCEHHLLPFIGSATSPTCPTARCIGLSKIPRIVDMFARRLQIQENLTKQIGESIQKVTGAKGVAVVIEAKHLCAMMRGVEKQNSVDDHLDDDRPLPRGPAHPAGIPDLNPALASV